MRGAWQRCNREISLSTAAEIPWVCISMGSKRFPGGNLTMHAELILEEANQGTAGVPSPENIS